MTLFGVRLRGGIWQVTQDGRFYGHYMADQPAFDAAQAAALAIVARGGAADIRWTERRPQAGAANHAKGLGAVPIGGAADRAIQGRIDAHPAVAGELAQSGQE